MKLLNKIRKPFSYTYINVALILIGINVLFFVISQKFTNLYTYCSLNVYNVIKGKMYWQFFTYMFVHSNLSHLFSNMLGLLFFGITLERSIGSKEFLLFYFVTGTLCGVFSFILNWILGAYGVFLMGASGVIYAILLLFAVSFPRSTIYIWGIIPLPAPILVIVYTIFELVSQFSANSNIAHYAHLAGFLFAYLYCLVRMEVNPWKVWKNNYHR